MKFYYEGDEPGGRTLSWFKLQLKAIGTLWDAELPEPVLTIIYSGIDSFGLLAARPVFLTQAEPHLNSGAKSTFFRVYRPLKEPL